MLVNLLAFVVVVGVLVILHEAGHFLAARAVGAPVDVFSVGFGKRLWGFKRGGTDYRISLIPLGGYVRVIGLGPDESQVTGVAEAEEELLPRWKRGIILLAGPITNIIAAIAFLALAFVLGVQIPAYQSQPPRVGWVEPDSPAAGAGVRPGDVVRAVDNVHIGTWSDLETSIFTSGGHRVHVELQRDGRTLTVAFTPTKVSRYGFGYSGMLPPLNSVIVKLNPGSPAQHSGLKPGDRIVDIDGQPVHQFYDMMRLISPHPGQQITVGFLRDGKRQEAKITPQDVGGEGKLGIPVVFPTRIEKLQPLAAFAASVRENRRMTVLTFRFLSKLIRRKTSFSQVSGPIDIARISGQAARSGIRPLIWFLGLISLQLGIFNLLPIPVLDGGHLAILSFETLRRRDLSIRVKERILEVGFLLLILLMVVVLYNDILKVLPENMYRFLHRG